MGISSIGHYNIFLNLGLIAAFLHVIDVSPSTLVLRPKCPMASGSVSLIRYCQIWWQSPSYIRPHQLHDYCCCTRRLMDSTKSCMKEGSYLARRNYVITKPITERWEMYPNLIMTLSQHFLRSAEWAVWLLIISVRVRWGEVRCVNFNNILQPGPPPHNYIPVRW